MDKARILIADDSACNRKAIAATTDGQFNEDAAAFISTQLISTEDTP